MNVHAGVIQTQPLKRNSVTGLQKEQWCIKEEHHQANLKEMQEPSC